MDRFGEACLRASNHLGQFDSADAVVSVRPHDLQEQWAMLSVLAFGRHNVMMVRRNCEEKIDPSTWRYGYFPRHLA